jgi:2-amino-4-hydroxy-6-hydroxymethyldihydropteridine diphosphokinase
VTATPRVRAYVGVGANVGDAVRSVREAVQQLRTLGGLRCSSLYRSAPVDAQGPDFINAVAELDTVLSPAALLAELQALEQAFGRERPYHHAPRTLDLDLLLHGNTVLQTPALHVPHPRLHQRAFVLLPLLELAPTLQAPGLGSLAAYLPDVADQPIERLAG